MVFAEEYSEEFDTLRKNRVKTSYHKYGSAKINYENKLINSLESMERAIEKYKSTGNKEYLCDAANYIMFEFMYPQRAGAFFRATDSSESAGICGISVKEMESMSIEQKE